MARLNVDIRSNESPMDFQWQQGHGPAGADSPFMKAGASNQSQNGFAGLKRRSSHLDGHRPLLKTKKITFKYSGSHTALESPPKPLLPALRDPASQTFLFPTTPSMKPPNQFRNHSFTTPQRSIDMDFSSGPDQSSPLNADTEDTPEPLIRSGVSKSGTSVVQFAGDKSDKRPQSSLGLFGKYASSGRGEIPRKTYTDAIARRVHKRRRRDADRDLRSAQRRGSFDSDSESHSRPSSREGPTPPQQHPLPSEAGLIPSIFTFIEKHPNLPHILSYYAQFLLNVFLVLFMMYLVYCFWSTIRSDVDMRSHEVASETLAEMAVCAREFQENRCDRSSRVPAVEAACNTWEKCMQQDPSKVGRARVSAHTFAEILNSFIEPISVKTMVSLSKYSHHFVKLQSLSNMPLSRRSPLSS